jgi:hypothetical protein
MKEGAVEVTVKGMGGTRGGNGTEGTEQKVWNGTDRRYTMERPVEGTLEGKKEGGNNERMEGNKEEKRLMEKGRKEGTKE